MRRAEPIALDARRIPHAVPGWAIVIRRERDGWSFAEAEEERRAGIVRFLPPIRVRQVRHATPEHAIHAGVAWLQTEGFV